MLWHYHDTMSVFVCCDRWVRFGGVTGPSDPCFSFRIWKPIIIVWTCFIHFFKSFRFVRLSLSFGRGSRANNCTVLHSSVLYCIKRGGERGKGIVLSRHGLSSGGNRGRRAADRGGGKNRAAEEHSFERRGLYSGVAPSAPPRGLQQAAASGSVQLLPTVPASVQDCTVHEATHSSAAWQQTPAVTHTHSAIKWKCFCRVVDRVTIQPLTKADLLSSFGHEQVWGWKM